MPTDDLCNYIENKANQGEVGGPSGFLNTLGGPLTALGSKIKKRPAPQPMSIEDQENRGKIQRQNIDDVNRLEGGNGYG